MNWFQRLFWGRPRRPQIVITTDGEQLRVDVDWPGPKSMSAEKFNRMADGLTATAHILTRGDGVGLGLIQQAVSHTARVRGEEEFGLYVNRSLNVLASHGQPAPRGPEADDQPVIDVWSFFPTPGHP